MSAPHREAIFLERDQLNAKAPPLAEGITLSCAASSTAQVGYFGRWSAVWQFGHARSHR